MAEATATETKPHPQGVTAADLPEDSNGPLQPTGNLREGVDEVHGEVDPSAELKAAVDAAEAKKVEDAKAKEDAAKAAEAEPEKGSDDWHKQFIQTGNEHADAAIEVMKEAGVSPIEANEVFKKAIESGKLEDINWTILEDKIGKAKAALVKAGVTTFYDNEYKERLAVVNMAHKIVDGEANWNKVRAWAQATEKSDPEVAAKVQSIRKGIDAGGWLAEQAVTELKKMYEAAPNNKGLGTANLVEGAKPAAKTSGDAIGREDFMKLTHELHNKGIPDGDAQYHTLHRRYQAGQAQGMR